MATLTADTVFPKVTAGAVDTVEITRATCVAGQPVAVGDVVTLPKADADYLKAIGKAKAYVAPAADPAPAPVADPQPQPAKKGKK